MKTQANKTIYSLWNEPGANVYYEWMRTDGRFEDLITWTDKQYFINDLRSVLDGNFSSEFRNNDPYSRIWEIELARQLKQAGFKILPTNGIGPDFHLQIDGRDIWIEAVLATPDEVLRIAHESALKDTGLTTNYPKEAITLRYTSVLNKKSKKYDDYIQKSIVKSEDIKLIAVTGYAYGVEMSSSIEHFLRAIAPVGDPVIHISRDGLPVKSATPLSTHNTINEYKNKNGSIVDKKFLFPGDNHLNIDGIIFSEISRVQEMLGQYSNFDASTEGLHIFPNYSSSRTIPKGIRDQFYFHDITLKDNIISIHNLDQGREKSKHGWWLGDLW